MCIKRVKTCGCSHTSNNEISHGCVETRKTTLSLLHACCRFGSAIKSLCHNSAGCLHVESHLNGNFSHNESRNVTFQCVTTRHVPWCLPLHPSRIWALGSVLTPFSSTSQERVANTVIQPLMNSCSIVTSRLAASMVPSGEFVCVSSNAVAMCLFAFFLYVRQ